MKNYLSVMMPAIILSSALVAAEAARKASPAKRANEEIVTAIRPPNSDASQTKIVPYGAKDVVRVKAKVRYTTLIVLPQNEEILDFVCGDKDFWVVNGTHNFAYIKPAKAGSQTNLNLVTASGNIYSFLLVDVSEDPAVEPDLKIFVDLKEESMTSAANGAPRFVLAREVDEAKLQADRAREETRHLKQAAQAAIDTGISKFVENVRFPYRFEAGRKPFFVRAMYTDDKFTYIQARPEEPPTLYEIKDKKPNLINFTYKNGLYVADKILDQGYLAIGKHKLPFSRQD